MSWTTPDDTIGDQDHAPDSVRRHIGQNVGQGAKEKCAVFTLGVGGLDKPRLNIGQGPETTLQLDANTVRLSRAVALAALFVVVALRRKHVLRRLILQGLLIWFVLALNQSAQAHYAYSAACCNERDCAPVDDDDVVELPDNAGYKIKGVHGIIPRKHRWIQHPIDTQNHICRLANGNIRCVYPKANPF